MHLEDLQPNALMLGILPNSQVTAVYEPMLPRQPHMLFYLEHAIQDASLTRSGERRVISKRMLYVELDADGATRHVHYAPYLDYRPLAEDEPKGAEILDRPECGWITRQLEQQAQGWHTCCGGKK